MAQPYFTSLHAADLTDQLAADTQIGNQSLLTHYACAVHYRKFFPADAWLNFWAGLGYFAREQHPSALDAFNRAWRFGLAHWRVHWYTALTAEQCERFSDALSAVQRLLKLMPDLDAAKELQQRLQTALAAKVQDCIKQAQEFLRAGRAADARVALKAAADLVPGQVLIMELLADLDCRLGNVSSARALLTSIIAREPARDNPRMQAIRRAVAETSLAKAS